MLQSLSTLDAAFPGSDEDLHPRSDQIPKRRYLAQRTRQVQFLPPAEAICLISTTRARRYRHRFLRRPNILEARSLSVGTYIGKSHQGSTRSPKSPGICLEGSGSNFPPCLNDDNTSVDLGQKAGFGVSKQKGIMKLTSRTLHSVSSSTISFICSGQEIPMAHKRKLAHDDYLGSAKIADAATDETCNPSTATSKNYK